MDWRTVAKNIELPLEIMGFPRRGATPARRRPAQARRARRRSRERHPWELSGGMQQRVAIARALVVRPEAAADGRAVRRARRDDPRADERRADEHLATDRDDDRVRHPQHPRGGVPVDPRRRHVGATRPDLAGHRHRPAAPTGRSRPANPSATSGSSPRVREALRQDEPTRRSSLPVRRGRSASRAEGLGVKAVGRPRVAARGRSSSSIVLVAWEVGFRVLGVQSFLDPAPDASSASSSWPIGRRSRAGSCSPGPRPSAGSSSGSALGTVARASRPRAGRAPARCCCRSRSAPAPSRSSRSRRSRSTGSGPRACCRGSRSSR